MTQPRMTPNLFETMLANRSASDRAFREALFADPKGTLAAELGVELPATLRVTIVEEGGVDEAPPSALNHWCLVLPALPPYPDPDGPGAADRAQGANLNGI